MLHFARETVLFTGEAERLHGDNAATLFATGDNDDYVVYLTYNDTHDIIFHINFGAGPAAFYLAKEFYDAVLNYLQTVISGFRFELPFQMIVADAVFISQYWQSVNLSELSDDRASALLFQLSNLIMLYRAPMR